MSTSLPAPRTIKTFLIIWIGQLISLLGSGLTGFALGVWIFEKTGQATPFALTVLMGTLPGILLAPVAGALADRWNRRWLMILGDTGDALVTLAVAVLLFLNRLDIGYVYLMAFFGSVFSTFQEPAWQASITMLVSKKDLTRANGLMQTGSSIVVLLSPLLAGVLFAVIGLQGILVIDFITYFAAIGALLFVRIPQPEPSTSGQEKKRASLGQDMLLGLQYLWSRAGLMGLLLYFAAVNFTINMAAVLTGPLVLSFGDEKGLGVVQTIAGVGMLLGGLFISAWAGPKRRIYAVVGFIAAASVGLLLIGLWPTLLVIGAGRFVMAFCLPQAAVSSQVIFQSKVAPEVQGRVFAVRGMIARSMMPLAMVLAGPLADRVFEPAMREGGWLAGTFVGRLLGTAPGRGIGLMFVLTGLILVLISALAWANPRIRRIESELPDAIPEAPEPAAPEPATAETSPAS